MKVHFCYHYGNTGCGVFKEGIQNQRGFWLKTNSSQMELPNLENWSSGEMPKSAQFNLQSKFSTSIIIRIFQNFFSLKYTNLEAHFLITSNTLIIKIWKFHLTKFEFQPKPFLIFYPSLENSTTGIAIAITLTFFLPKPSLFTDF